MKIILLCLFILSIDHVISKSATLINIVNHYTWWFLFFKFFSNRFISEQTFLLLVINFIIWPYTIQTNNFSLGREQIILLQHSFPTNYINVKSTFIVTSNLKSYSINRYDFFFKLKDLLRKRFIVFDQFSNLIIKRVTNYYK